MQQKESNHTAYLPVAHDRPGYFSYCYRRGEFFTKNIFLRCNGFRRPFAGTRPHTLLEDPAPRSSYTLNLMIAVFFILLYTIGVVLQGYNIPYYDKFCHTLSGTVTAFGGLHSSCSSNRKKPLPTGNFPLELFFPS